MRSRLTLTRHLLEEAHAAMRRNVADVTLAEALFVPQGGYRSILGTLKHAAGWSHVYRSYAFDDEPRHWVQADWPRGLRDTIDPSREYLDEVIGWFDRAHDGWLTAIDRLSDADLDAPRSLHWGERIPLFDVVVLVAQHHVYHAGEANQLLSICRGEAWEEGEEVEENHISTLGHRVRPPWLDAT